MQLDWFTFIAQIVNFGILVWLLNRFLYGPITDSISARESAIAARIKSADDRFDAATQREHEWRALSDKLTAEQGALRDEARQETEQQRLTMLQSAREPVEQQRADWQKLLQREQAAAARDIKSQTAETALNIARRALTGLAGSDLDRQIAATLGSQIEDLDEATLADLRSSLAPESRIVVTSARPLSTEVVAAIESVLAATFGPERGIEFAESADLISGVRVRLGAHEFGWSIEDYLDSVGTLFDQQLAATEA